MSVIEKMAIMGIRSFGPEDHNKGVIEFFSPLTLILGPNGSGKTTIIECLRYMTTGDCPPNSERGSSFVHDPKIANETEVKGQVKLQFHDVHQAQVYVTRSLIVTQKQKKLQLKTLEGSITRRNKNGTTTSLSSKCAEIDREMISALGVSKPILNNVIFCHQEESNWPLSEGKALKQKFDEIFAATRYIKALEELRKLRLEKMNNTKEYKVNVTHLEENERKAKEFQKKLRETESKLAACADAITEAQDKLTPVVEKLSDISAKEQHIAKLHADLTSTKTLLGKSEKDQRTLKNSIKNLFVGTKDELLTEMENFNVAVHQKRKDIEKVKKKCIEAEKDKNNLLRTKSKFTEELGQLKTEHKQHEDRLAVRDSKLGDLSITLGLGEICPDSVEPFRESQVENIIRNWKQKISTSQLELKNTKLELEAQENSVQTRIDSVRDSCAQKVQKKKSSTEKMDQNRITIDNIRDELNEANSLAARQEELKNELAEAESDLSENEKKIDLIAIRKKIEELQKKKKIKDQNLNLLIQEREQLHKESKLRTEIDLVMKEKGSKQEISERLLSRHKDTVVHLLGSLPPKNIQDSVNKWINTMSQESKSSAKVLNKHRDKLTTLMASKKFSVEQLKQKEDTLKMHMAQIAEVCGSQNFDEGLEVLEKNVKELQDEKGSLTGSLYLYNKYVEKLSIRKPCCPLCQRAFPQEKEAQTLAQDLKKKLQQVPSQLSKKEKLIEDHQKRLNKMLELRPLKREILKLSEQEIPNLKEKIDQTEDNIEVANSDMTNLEEDIDLKNGELKKATDMLPDLAMLDQALRDLDRIERRLSTLTCQVKSSDVSRTISQVTAEITNAQTEVEKMKNEIEVQQQNVSDFSDLIQKLKSQVNDLRAEQIEIAGRLQKQNALDEQLTNLIAENAELQESVKELKEEIIKLQQSVQKLTKEKKDLTKDKEQKLEAIRKRINEEEKEMDYIEKLMKQIDSYVNEGREARLTSHENKISSLNKDIESKSEDISRLSNEEKSLSNEITSQQIKYREYEDNKKCMELDEEIDSYKLKSQKLDREIGGIDVKTYLSEKRNLIAQEKQFTKELNENECRKDELSKHASEWKKQLKDKIYVDAERKLLHMLIHLRTTQVLCDDLSKFYGALDCAIMRYHQMKMDEINKIIRDLWIKTYSGNDIDYIEIRSNADESESGLEKAKRVYNYKVVMIKGDKVMDLRSRCSAGQKVLASLLIRLALAEVFCLNCGILALDEPTTNLDRDNICNLARALVEIVQSRSEQKNFQLIIITHDEDFIDLLGRSETVDYFYKVSKDANSCSKISKCRLSEMG